MMEDKPKGKVWSWTTWTCKIDTSNMQKGDLTVQVRAIDSQGKMQDGVLKDLFNIRGILNNCPHTITINVL